MVLQQLNIVDGYQGLVKSALALTRVRCDYRGASTYESYELRALILSLTLKKAESLRERENLEGYSENIIFKCNRYVCHQRLCHPNSCSSQFT